MLDVKVEHNPQDERLEELGVFGWPIWTKEESEFPWTYDATETCYLLEGEGHFSITVNYMEQALRTLIKK